MKNSENDHNTLVSSLARKYEEQGYYVKADHINHTNGRPSEMYGYIPDIAAYKDGKLCIIAEAETFDTISTFDTQRQWSAFSSSIHRFEVIVPKSCFDEAKQQANRWGVKVDNWWYLEI